MEKYHLITDKRARVAHVAGPAGTPLCKPVTKIAFTATLIGRDMRFCPVCAERQTREQFNAALKRRASMTLAEQLDDIL
jgi:hypothetical protein